MKNRILLIAHRKGIHQELLLSKWMPLIHKHYLGNYNFNTRKLELFIFYKEKQFKVSNPIDLDFQDYLESILNNYFIEVFTYNKMYP